MCLQTRSQFLDLTLTTWKKALRGIPGLGWWKIVRNDSAVLVLDLFLELFSMEWLVMWAPLLLR